MVNNPQAIVSMPGDTTRLQGEGRIRYDCCVRQNVEDRRNQSPRETKNQSPATKLVMCQRPLRLEAVSR